MKKQKMSLEKMRGILVNALSREEMKEVMAGSGGGGTSCSGLNCLPSGLGLGQCTWHSGFSACRCNGNPMYYACGS